MEYRKEEREYEMTQKYNLELIQKLQKEIPIHDKTVTMRDHYRREKTYQNNRNSVVQYEMGEEVKHPKFGTGKIEKIEPMSGSVRLHIRFGEELKIIDQKWLLRTKYQRAGER